MLMRAAVSETLPVSVLLGTDIPELGQLLRSNPCTLHTRATEDALVVTRAQAKENARVERQTLQKERKSEVHPSPRMVQSRTYPILF